MKKISQFVRTAVIGLAFCIPTAAQQHYSHRNPSFVVDLPGEPEITDSGSGERIWELDSLNGTKTIGVFIILTLPATRYKEDRATLDKFVDIYAKGSGVNLFNCTNKMYNGVGGSQDFAEICEFTSTQPDQTVVRGWTWFCNEDGHIWTVFSGTTDSRLASATKNYVDSFDFRP